jgi:hypothetical protein
MKKLLSILALSSLVGAAGLQAQFSPSTAPSKQIGKYTSQFYCSLISGPVYLNNGKLKAVSMRAINQALAKNGSNQVITATPIAIQLNQACGHATGLIPANNSEGLCLGKQGASCGFSSKQLQLCVGFECYNNKVMRLVK